MSNQPGTGLSDAYLFLKSGDPGQAIALLKDALVYDLENKEIIFALRCCNFWVEEIRQIDSLEDSFEKGESLITEWKSFQSFIEREKNPIERTIYAVRTGIFSLALRHYSSLLEEVSASQKAEVWRRMGLCYKELGQYETARDCLTEANSNSKGESAILSELADCYALCGEERQAKVLFREAFFLDASKIDINFLESELICCLIKKVAEKKYTGTILKEWIPVYGQLYGVFNVKRKLRPQEVGKLKQEIYSKENEMKDPACDVKAITPRLINLYFWLIDYYVLLGNENRSINGLLVRIKILDSEIYSMFVK